LGKAEQRLFEHRQFQVIDDGLAGLLDMDEAGFPQHCEMRRHGRLGDVKVVAKLARAHRSGLQQLQDAAAGRVGKGFEYGVHDSIFSQSSNYCQARWPVPLSEILNSRSSGGCA